MTLLDLETLSQSPLTVEGRLVDASNATLYGSVSLSTEKTFAVVYKPIAGERPLWDFNEGNLASREVAAYKVSIWLGFDCVPPTVLRDGPYGPGAVQQWIDVDESVDIIALGQSDRKEIRQMALFDAVINNTDRKFGHILPSPTGQIYGCDHGVTFHVDNKLRTVIWQFAGDEFSQQERESLQRLRDLLDGQGRSNLSTLLSQDEITALQKRLDNLLESGIFPFPSQEWPAIPWPPV